MDHPEDALPAPPRGRLRTAVRGAGFAVAGLVGVLLIGVALLQVDAVGTAVVRAVGKRLAPAGLRLEVERVSGSWLRSLEFVGLRLVASDDAPAFAVDTLVVDWSLPALVSRRVALTRVHAVGAEVHLERGVSGGVGLRGADPSPPAVADAGADSVAPSPWTIVMDSAHLGDVSGDLRTVGTAEPSLVWDEGEIRLAALRMGPELAAHLVSASIRVEAPALPGADATGPVRIVAAGEVAEGRLRLDSLVARGRGSHLSVQGTLAMPESDGAPGALALEVAAEGFPLALLHGALGRTPDESARVDGTVQVSGTTRVPAAVVDLRLRGGGRIAGSVAATLDSTSTGVAGDLMIERLDPGRVLADTLWSGQVDGRIAVELEGEEMSRLGGRADLDFAAIEVPGLPVRRANLTSVWTDGEAATDLRVEADLGTVALTGTVRPLDSLPSYDLQGPVQVSIAGDSVTPVNATGRFRIEGVGVTPELARATADLEVSSLAVGGVRLTTATVRARLDEGALAWQMAAQDQATGRLRASGDLDFGTPITLRVDSATVHDFDLADLLGEAEGSRIDATARGSAVLGDGLRSEARFDVRVRHARWGAIRIDTTVVTGRLADGVVSTDLWVRSSAGRLIGALAVRPFEATPHLDIDSLTFVGLDLGAALQTPADSGASPLSTRLTGRLTGRVDGSSVDQATATVDVELGPSRVNRQELTRAEGRVTLAAGRVALDLAAELPDSGRVAVVARASPFLARPTVVIDSFVFAGIDPFAVAGTAAGGMDARLAGQVTARIEGTDPGSLAGELTLGLAPSRLNRSAITGGQVEATVRSGRWEAAGDIDFSDGRLVLDAGADVAADSTTWALDVGLQSEAPGRLVGAAVEEGYLDATIHVDGRGTDLGSSLAARFRATADSASLGEVRVDTLRLAGEIVGGFARFDTLTLRSNVADVTGGGLLALTDSPARGASDLSVEVTLRSLTPLEPWVGLQPLGLGEGRVVASVTGPPDALRWTTSARASALLLGPTTLLGLEVDASGGLAPGLVPTSFDGELHLDRLTALGIDVRATRLSALWDGDEITLEGEATVDDRRDVAFTVQADPRGESPRATLERVDIRIDDDRWALEGTPSVAWGEGLQFDRLTLRSGAQRLSLDGRFDPAGTNDLAAHVEAIRLGGLTDLLGYERLDGTLTSTLRLEGSAADPRVRGDLAADLAWASGARSSVQMRVAYDTLLLDLDARIGAEGGGELTVRGVVPVDLALTARAEGDTTRLASVAAGPVDLEIRADSFALAWIEPFLDPATARGLSGHLDIDARVQGTQASPSLSGRMQLQDGRLTIPTLGVTYDRAVLAVALEGDRARIDSAQVRTDDGTLTLTGGVNLPELALGEFDLQARFDRFRAIHNDAYRVRLSGTAELMGTTDEPRLEGDLHLVETDVYLDEAMPSGASVRAVELTEDELRELEEYLGYSVRPSAREPGALFDLLALDVAVSASRDSWVRQRTNPEAEIQLTGDVRVTKQPRDSLHFDGRVEAVPRRSWVRQFGRRFSIEQGVVELRGTAPETRVDVRAVYEVPSTSNDRPEASITLDIEGTLTDLSLTLGSEPSMENADIVSYLARGRPASSSFDVQGDDEGGGLRGMGSDFALGQVTGLVEGLAAEGVGLDVVEIRTDGLRGATLIAGRYVTPAVYVGFKQPVGRSPEDRAAGGGSLAQTEVELEIQTLRWLLLSMEASNSTISFLFGFRYAY